MKTQSIFDYLSSRENDGHGYAILDPRGMVVDPYVDPSDYPDMEVDEHGKGINKYNGWWIHCHDGILEQKPDYFFDGKFTHHVDLDERGYYRATVRDHKDETVFTIRAGAELDEDESSIFDDGFMKNKKDMKGLKDYLISLGIMGSQDTLTDCK